MKEALLPFFGYLIVQIFIFLAGLNLVRDRNMGINSLIKSWIMGQMLLFAVVQLVSVPMIIFHRSFNELFLTASCIFACLIGAGVFQLKKRKFHFPSLKMNWLATTLLIVSAIVIFSQAGLYFFGIHLDEDDARWLAEANDALEYGQLMTRNVNTGEYIGTFQTIRDVVSPWPMLLAILSRILFTRTAIVAHTLYPPIELLFMYAVYYLIAVELFSKKETRFTFLLLVSVISFFFGGNGYTQAVFFLTRIWQGKATVAGVVIPLLLYLAITIQRKDLLRDWLSIAIVSTGACLMSGMGIFISLLLAGMYGLYTILACQRWKRIPVWLISLLPSLAFMLTYYYMNR